MKYYLDTSIWLDFYEKRGRNGELALQLILKIIEENSIILYSDLHINELKRLGFDIDAVNKILSIAKPDNLIRVHIYKEQDEKARKIASIKNIPKGDVLHAILCRDNEAQLVTRDPDFQRISYIAKPSKPEELI